MTMSAQSPTMVLPVHRLTPFLRVRISSGAQSLTVEHQRAVFGIIPMPKERIELPFGAISSARVITIVRFQSLIATAALVGAIVWLPLPVVAVVGFAIVALLELLLSIPNKALRVARADGRHWTIPFCRDYAFDVSLAFMDAEQHSSTARSTSTRHP
jgi:hypothetical protein